MEIQPHGPSLARILPLCGRAQFAPRQPRRHAHGREYRSGAKGSCRVLELLPRHESAVSASRRFQGVSGQVRPVDHAGVSAAGPAVHFRRPRPDVGVDTVRRDGRIDRGLPVGSRRAGAVGALRHGAARVVGSQDVGVDAAVLFAARGDSGVVAGAVILRGRDWRPHRSVLSVPAQIEVQLETVSPSSGRPRVVIIGGGFGGLSAARAFRHAPVDVLLIDRRNHHVFQPLLYQVATAALSPGDIASPIRWILRKQRNVEVWLADATAIDTVSQRVILADGEVQYDYLIVSTGATHTYLGHTEWGRLAPGLRRPEVRSAR